MTCKRWRLAAATFAVLAATSLAVADPPEPRIEMACEKLPPAREAATPTQIKAYSVADLVSAAPLGGSAPAPNGATCTCEHLLITAIQRFIAPGAWCDQGGAGTIDFHPLTMALVVNQTPAVQEQVAEFLETLRKFQPAEYTVQMRLGKGCSNDVQALPRLTLLDHQTARVFCAEKAMAGGEVKSPGKGGSAVEVCVMSIDKGRLGLSLDVQVGKDDGKTEHVRAVREVKEGETFKLPVGVPGAGEQQKWVEVVVKKASEEAEHPATCAAETAPAKPTCAAEQPLDGMTLPSGCYLQHPPQYFPPPLPLPREATGVVQAKHEVKVKAPAKAKASATLQMPGGVELSVRTAGKRVIIKGPTAEAWADRVVFEHGGDSVVLEGNVRLKYSKDGAQGSLHASKVRLRSDGLIDLNPETPPPTPLQSPPPTSWGDRPSHLTPERVNGGIQ
jgi:hypothetical protein